MTTTMTRQQANCCLQVVDDDDDDNMLKIFFTFLGKLPEGPYSELITAKKKN